MRVFFPPELAVQEEFEMAQEGTRDAQADLLKKLYFQRLYQPNSEDNVDRQIVRLVLDRAKRVVAHPSRPMLRRFDTFDRVPWAELALEETLEESPSIEDTRDVLVEIQEEKPFFCTAILDCSSSMSGEKHLLASVAVAVLLLEVHPKDTALVVFASQAVVVKKLLDEEAVEDTVMRFLKTRPKGFTNIHRGLEAGLKQTRRSNVAGKKIALIATDGRTTEGGDPGEMARQFDCLVVLHLHGPGSDLEASQLLAQRGNGVCLEVDEFSSLPHRLYDAIRILGRR